MSTATGASQTTYSQHEQSRRADLKQRRKCPAIDGSKPTTANQ